MPADLQIRLLGGFKVLYRSELISDLNTPRLQSLLAYLLLHRDAPLSRQSLAFLFWPDTSDSQARANLRNLLHALRGALPDEGLYLQTDIHTIQWHPESAFELDVAKFEAAAGQSESIGSLQNAARLYTGDLLPSCYDEWILPERERLRQLYESALEKLINHLEEQRNYSEAIRFSQTLIQHDPLNEAAYRRLMRLHSLNGDRPAALRVYHTCATMLQRELDVEPSPATQEAYERLQRVEITRQETSPLLKISIPLVGREREWSSLQAAWRAIAPGEPRFVLISGEAGIGKTRLAEELMDWAGRQGIPAAAAKAYASGKDLAYAAAAAWLRGRSFSGLEDLWLSEVSRLLPELRQAYPDLTRPEPITENWQRLHLFEALARALLCDHPAQLVLLDDIQWCDRETLEWLSFLLHPNTPLLSQHRLYILATMRSEETNQGEMLPSFLADLARIGRLMEISLKPLDEAEVVTLAEKLTNGKMEPALAASLYRETEGNPLFVVETLRSASTQEQLPSKIQEVIASRLAQLSPPAGDLAGDAAVLGRQFTFEMLRQASGEEENHLVNSLDELWRRRILKEEGSDAYNFSHDKIREVAYAGLSQARRRLLHKRAAETLQVVCSNDPDSASSLVAEHYERAGQIEPAVHWYQRSGEAARRIYALNESVVFFRKALDLLALLPKNLGASSEREALLWESLGDTQLTVGHPGEAERCYRQSLSFLGQEFPIQRSQMQRKIGRSYSARLELEDALKSYEAATATLGEIPTGENKAWWQAWLQIQLDRIDTLYFHARVDEMEALVVQIREVVQHFGTLSQQAGFLSSLVLIRNWRERYRLSDETVELCQQFFMIKKEQGGLSNLAYGHFALGLAYLWSGSRELALKHLEEGLDLAMKGGEMYIQCQCNSYLACLWRLNGDIEKTGKYADRALAIARSIGSPLYVGFAEANLAWVLWRQGDGAKARQKAEAAVELLLEKDPNFPFMWAAAWQLISMDLDEDRVEHAVRNACLLLRPQEQRPPDSINQLLEFAVSAGEKGDLKTAADHLSQAVDLAKETCYL